MFFLQVSNLTTHWCQHEKKKKSCVSCGTSSFSQMPCEPFCQRYLKYKTEYSYVYLYLCRAYHLFNSNKVFVFCYISDRDQMELNPLNFLLAGGRAEEKWGGQICPFEQWSPCFNWSLRTTWRGVFPHEPCLGGNKKILGSSKFIQAAWFPFNSWRVTVLYMSTIFSLWLTIQF